MKVGNELGGCSRQFAADVLSNELGHHPLTLTGRKKPPERQHEMLLPMLSALVEGSAAVPLL
eukprot:3648354-Rhodomonas_salina.1